MKVCKATVNFGPLDSMYARSDQMRPAVAYTTQTVGGCRARAHRPPHFARSPVGRRVLAAVPADVPIATHRWRANDLNEHLHGLGSGAWSPGPAPCVSPEVHIRC